MKGGKIGRVKNKKVSLVKYSSSVNKQKIFITKKEYFCSS